MYAFPTVDELYGVLENLFSEVQHRPDDIADFAHSNLVVRINVIEPEGQILLDGRQPPMQAFFGPSPGEANFEMTLSGDILHQLLNGDISLAAALFNGEIKTKGNVVRAQPFIELLHACQPVYKRL